MKHTTVSLLIICTIHASAQLQVSGSKWKSTSRQTVLQFDNDTLRATIAGLTKAVPYAQQHDTLIIALGRVQSLPTEGF